jgi:hypothetical protein
MVVQHELRGEGGSGSSSSPPMADMDDDEDNVEAWKQGDATKQVCHSLRFVVVGCS